MPMCVCVIHQLDLGFWITRIIVVILIESAYHFQVRRDSRQDISEMQFTNRNVQTRDFSSMFHAYKMSHPYNFRKFSVSVRFNKFFQAEKDFKCGVVYQIMEGSRPHSLVCPVSIYNPYTVNFCFKIVIHPE